MKNVFRKKKNGKKQFEQSVSGVVRDFPAVVSLLHIFEKVFFLLRFLLIDFLLLQSS